MQSGRMQQDWASENLHVIRTLMERSAVYRRALAPLMGAVGLTGVAAAVAAALWKVQTPRGFASFWMGVAAICLVEAFLLIRRQALKEDEVFWSPPTRRVVQALFPAFFAGVMAGLIFLWLEPGGSLAVWLLVPGWMTLYGCALHAAGFFMPRGFKLFGWAFVAGGCVLAAGIRAWVGRPRSLLRTGRWAGFSGGPIWLMASICTLLNSAGMRREPETLPPARPCYSREGAVADHVAAGCRAGAFLYRIARHVENDRRKFEPAHKDPSRGGFYFC